MTFELGIYRAQMFAAKLQASNQKTFWGRIRIAVGALITQNIMGMCFYHIMAKGQKQWQKQRSAKLATKKSAQAKKPVPSADASLPTLNRK